MADDLFTQKRIAVFVFDLAVIGQRAFAYDKGHVMAFCQQGAVFCHDSFKFFFSRIFADDKVSDAHVIQQCSGDLTLVDMLGFIMNTGFSAPAYNKDHRDRIYLFIQQGCRGVDDVAFTAVLHIDDRNFSCSHMVSCRKTDAVAFVGSDDMMLRIDPVCAHQPVA